MKKKHFSLLITFIFHLASHAQWATIYESGTGTPIDLDQDWGSTFFFHSPSGSNNVFTSCGTPGSTNNAVNLFYYTSDFESGRAGIYEQIPGMENYASLRIYVESDLPDSIGTLTYATMNDGEFQDNLGNPLWNVFATDQIGQTIPFSNNEGNDMIYLYADLLRGDSISFRINYVRIEADTTQFVGIPVADQNNFQAFTSRNVLHIQSQNNEQSYSINLYNSAGMNVFQATGTGSQNIPLEFETGIYYAYFTFEDESIKQIKVFIE